MKTEMAIDITGVRPDPAADQYLVSGAVGRISRTVVIDGLAVDLKLREIGATHNRSDYTVGNMSPVIVTLAFPLLVQAFRS